MKVAEKRMAHGSKTGCVVVGAFLFLLSFAGCRDMGTAPVQAPPEPVIQKTVSFQRDILPIFASPRVGCLACHGGTNDLFLGTVADILRGGQHGPAVVAGNSAGSLLVQKIGPNPPFGDRMPFGSTPLPDATIQLIKDWIDQGALDN
jgi:hypothetical protein